jgi:hypothetical protein
VEQGRGNATLIAIKPNARDVVVLRKCKELVTAHYDSLKSNDPCGVLVHPVATRPRRFVTSR